MPEIKKRQYPGKLIPGILAIDQGTHASRATLYDLSGNALESVEKEIALNRISETEIEQDPDEILVSVKTVFQKILKNNPEKVNIQGIGIATQRSSLIAWNKAGNALSPVISWQDRRTRNEIQNIKLLNPDIESVVRRKTGLPLSPHYGASKFHWLLKHNVEVQKAVAVNNLRLGPLVSFLMYNLLDGQPFQVDHANASRTLLWNMETGEWDEDLLRLFGIDKKLLPKCKPVLADYGNWAGIPVKAVSGDQNAAVFSEGIPGEDMAIINIGSGAFILKPTESFIPHEKLLSGISCTDHHKMYYTLEGTVNGAATAINWAKEKIQENIDLDSAIKSSKTPILFINTVGGLGSPLWKSGPEPYWLDEPKTPEEALAAVAESIVFLLKMNLEEIQKTGQKIERSRVSGGLSQSDALCQKLSDLFSITLTRSAQTEATSRGIAFLAANMPEGWLKSPVRTFFPSKEINAQFEARYRKFYEIILSI